MSAPRCAVCHDSGSKNQTGDYLDCQACDMPMIRKALNDFVKSLGPTHPEDVALAIHQRALTMAPKQEAPRQWVAIKDSAWVNIVNHDHAYDGWDKDDIINHVFKLTEAKCKELNGPYAAPAAANGALTDEKIMEIIWQFQAGGDDGKFTFLEADLPHMFRAILAATGPDAALIDEREAFEAWCKTRGNGAVRMKLIDQYLVPDVQAAWASWQARAALSGAKGN